MGKYSAATYDKDLLRGRMDAGLFDLIQLLLQSAQWEIYGLGQATYGELRGISHINKQRAPSTSLQVARA